VIAGESPLAFELREAAGEAGWAVADPLEAQELASPFLILDLTGGEEPEAPLQGAPQAICVTAGSLAALDPGGSAVGFHALPPLRSSRLVELTRGPDSAESAARAAERFFQTLGKHTLWIGDTPGLVLGRIVCQVVNEAAFALGEGLGSAEDIDAGMIHGLNYREESSPGRTRSASTTSSQCSTALMLERGRSATEWLRCCAGSDGPGGWDASPGRLL